MKESFKRKKIKFVLSAIAILSTVLPFAQTTPTAVAVPVDSGLGMMWWMVIGVMAVLLFAVLILGDVMVKLARIMADKSKGSKATSLILLLLVSVTTFAQDATVTPKAAETNTLPNWNAVMAVTVMVIILFVVFVLLFRIRLMLKEIAGKEQTSATAAPVIQLPKILDAINASVSIEQEKDVLLDHNYDGIQELDNKLPPWWVYGFYATIIFAVVYMFYYHLGGGGISSHEAYAAEMAEAKVAKNEYMLKNALNVDENTVTLADAAGIAEGKTIFAASCSPCHGADGQGVVGPNLTDDYWLHGGSLKDIFKTVKVGFPAKGMKSWATDLTPVQIKNVSSYIKTLHGTNPANAKSPQGDLYSEGGAAKTDSTAIVTK